MARKPNWPPNRTIHPSSGLERIRFKGHDYYLGEPGSPEADAEYQRLLLVLAPSVNGGQPPPAKPLPAECITVAGVVARWWVEDAQRYDELSREPENFRLSLAPLLELFGSQPAASFDANALEAVQMHMGKIGWCRNVINRRIVRIRTVWRWADRKGLVPRGSWDNLRTLPGLSRADGRVKQTAKTKPATAEQVEAIAIQARPVVGAMLRLQWISGMRSGELREMQAGDVERSGEVWIYRPGQHKGLWREQDRVVAIGPEGQKILAPWLSGKKPGDYVFPPAVKKKNGNTHYTNCGYGNAVLRAARKAGFTTWRPYQCRHGAKQRITRQASLDEARAVLGQRSLGTTASYGDAIDIQSAIDAAKKFG